MNEKRWAAVGALSSPDAQGNVVRGEGVVMDANNVYVRSEEGLTAVVTVADNGGSSGRLRGEFGVLQYRIKQSGKVLTGQWAQTGCNS